MNMTLIFEISIARAQKDINSMQVQCGGSQPLERPERHSRISPPSVSLIICNLTLRRGGGGGGG